MWFEVLPSFAIITACIAIPHFGAYVINKVVVGNMYRRQINTFDERIGYLRNRRVAGGNPYKVNGLESLPDA